MPGRPGGNVEKPEVSWKKEVEKKAKKLVDLERRKSLVSSAIFRETGVLSHRRKELSGELIQRIGKAKGLSKGEEAVLVARVKKEATLEKEIAKLSTGAVKVFRKFQFRKLLEAFRKANEIRTGMAISRMEIAAVEAMEGEPVVSDYEVIAEARRKLDALKKEYQELLHSSPEAFIGLHLQELKGYRKSLDKGEIVETPYVREKIEEIVAHLKANIPVFLYGHYGSGKTELARHVVRNYLSQEKIAEFIRSHPKPRKEDFRVRSEDSGPERNEGALTKGGTKLQKTVEKIRGLITPHPKMQRKVPGTEAKNGKAIEYRMDEYKKALAKWQGEVERVGEPIVFRGAKDVTLDELYGHLALVRRDSKGGFEEFYQAVEEEKGKFFRKHPDLSREQKEYYAQLIQIFVTNKETQGTVTDFMLGPVYRAAKEGKTLIIDEVNAIPHSVLISLNDILTRKPGELIYVQEDGVEPIRIKEGFSIILTGNVGERYERLREKMDIAFLSRAHPIHYDYLPQYYPQKPDDNLLLEENASEHNELFHLLLAMVMDKNGNIRAPRGAINKLWKLAMNAKVIQDVFSQKLVSQELYGYQESGGGRYLYRLTSGVPSIRSLERVVRMWKASHFKYELDHYLWQDYLEEIVNLKDRAYVFQILSTSPGGFFEGWQHSDYSAMDSMAGFRVEDPKRRAEPVKFYGPAEVVKAAFGEIPERKEYPEIDEMSPEEKERILFSLEKKAISLRKQIRELQGLFSDFEVPEEEVEQLQKDKKALEEAKTMVESVLAECEKLLSGKTLETDEDFDELAENLSGRLGDAVSHLSYP